mmetsp:Transcript_32737/g.71459  ORF Transcript_32737/g.71459 Transcript_32737/m.71459 type:complete len:352 (-) Transcript_32737:52-1107(-)
MADRENELRAEKESIALKKLQAAAGLIDKSQTIERLDWMYEQSAAQSKPDDDKLMNMPVAGQVDKDIEDVKKLGENTAGSLFLKSATKTTEDVLRKLREDPLFQIKRQEQAARESAMSNPLIRARILKKEEKQRKKEQKKAKKAAKKAAGKEKKAMKKAAKKEKKAMKKASSDSSDSSDESSAALGAAAAGGGRQEAGGRDSRGAASPARRRSRSPKREEPDVRSLGPNSQMVSKREERAAQIAERRDKALASRGAASRMSEEEKQRRVDQMRQDAARHSKHVDDRIAAAEQREKEIGELEKDMRNNSDQKYFRDMRTSAYSDSNATLEDRMKSQRHRRQKHINDPLERDN